MTTIELKIKDDVVRAFGREMLEMRLKKFIKAEELRLLGQKIQASIKDAGLENEVILEEARQEAWEEYKNTTLKNVLK